MYTRQEISDRTGFDAGDKFENEQQLREYFEAKNLADTYEHEPEHAPSQDELDDMVRDVLANRWHCDF